MNIVIKSFALTLLLGTSGGTFADRDIETSDFSGWMDDYDSLVYREERNAFVFFNEAKRGAYSKVILEEVSIYSKSGDTEAEIADRASSYLRNGIAALLTSKGRSTEEASDKALKLSIAITGVEKTKEELKAYNFIPVAAVFRGAQAATGNVSTYIDTMFEAKMTDSVTGERVAAIVSKGIEETEKRSGDELSFEDIQPTLDKWLAQYAHTLDTYFAE